MPLEGRKSSTILTRSPDKFLQFHSKLNVLRQSLVVSTPRVSLFTMR